MVPRDKLLFLSLHEHVQEDISASAQYDASAVSVRRCYHFGDGF